MLTVRQSNSLLNSEVYMERVPKCTRSLGLFATEGMSVRRGRRLGGDLVAAKWWCCLKAALWYFTAFNAKKRQCYVLWGARICVKQEKNWVYDNIILMCRYSFTFETLVLLQSIDLEPLTTDGSVQHCERSQHAELSLGYSFLNINKMSWHES